METWTPEQWAESDYEMGGNQSTNRYEEGTIEHSRYAWRIAQLTHPGHTEFLNNLYGKVS